MEKKLKHISKFMSLVLRHRPEQIGLRLDANGWASVQELIDRFNESGMEVDALVIAEVVETNDKKRFAFNEDRTMIRASQGHSINVDLSLLPTIPPDVLFHGTATKYLDGILENGLEKQSRQHVHLSNTIETAMAVGSRHGKPVILHINAKAMHDAGFCFYLSANNVWLTEAVPKKYISQ